ncbi:flagellar assembly protein FliW [Oceanirhabdus sp. W0125-5]|uniref:flagellar assembly protein FliW n=1 Tax=Oceanirhabdus sp. W0125-5 TaxID=2999116 RepID=UPI0022F2C19D|nr:flagellar assembly protein FliW [Oceanirhabdus sp. W0125-5]WBW95470.1 flagellar assembly protein FliW [Oceanirhabdus sp. W0125-5]
MELISKVHGKIQYSDTEIVTFKKGLPGFENLKRFIIKDIEGNPIFKIMHSLDRADIAFVIVSPFNCDEKYQINLSNEVLKNLNIIKPTDVMLYTIVTLHSDYKKITSNLRAPIVVNIKNNLGEQIISNNDEYLVKHLIFKEEVECL